MRIEPFPTWLVPSDFKNYTGLVETFHASFSYSLLLARIIQTGSVLGANFSATSRVITGNISNQTVMGIDFCYKQELK